MYRKSLASVINVYTASEKVYTLLFCTKFDGI